MIVGFETADDAARAGQDPPTQAADQQRGALLLCSSLCFVTALKSLPVAEATALNFLAPVLVVILSVLVLGERLTRLLGLWGEPSELVTVDASLDALGADVDLADLADDKNRYALFCTHVRLTWLIDNQMMRADVRVFWPRGVTTAPDPKFCDDPALAAEINQAS